jgi:hypothetical protein
MNWKTSTISAEIFKKENRFSVHEVQECRPRKYLLAGYSFVKISIIFLFFSRTLFCTQFVWTTFFDSSYILVDVVSARTVTYFHTAYRMDPL